MTPASLELVVCNLANCGVSWYYNADAIAQEALVVLSEPMKVAEVEPD